ncbi:MAG: hypothetical protein Fur0037_07570 [Planctomycetota bacterium]
MNGVHIPLAIAALTVAAESQINPFVFYPQDPERQTVTCTSFVGRPDWNRDGEALMQIDTPDFRGVGDSNGSTLLVGIYHWVAEENLSTIETYDLVIRARAPKGAPELRPYTEYLRINGLTTPPSSNPNRGTWIMYDGFHNPYGLWLGNWPLYVGVHLPANPAWPNSDGHSLFRADMLTANTGATVGENHRIGAPNPTWAVVPGPRAFSAPWTYMLGPLVRSPNLHMGGLDPTSNRLGASGANFGLGGLYPDIRGNPRREGLVARVTDNFAPYAWVFLGGGEAFQPPWRLLAWSPYLIGLSHIGDPDHGPISIATRQLQNGVMEVPIAMPGTIPTSLIGADLVFQAVVFDPNTYIGEWTNAQAVHM